MGNKEAIAANGPAGVPVDAVVCKNGVEATCAGDVPELLAVVQTTCANLAEKLRHRARVSQSDGEAAAACQLSAVRAARELLGEVEAAFLSSSSGSTTDIEFVDTSGAKQTLAPARQALDCEINSREVPTAEWFDVSTPKGQGKGVGS